jgi:hypothetical protein
LISRSIDDFVVEEKSSGAEFVCEKRAHISDSEDDGSDIEVVPTL